MEAAVTLLVTNRLTTTVVAVVMVTVNNRLFPVVMEVTTKVDTVATDKRNTTGSKVLLPPLLLQLVTVATVNLL